MMNQEIWLKISGKSGGAFKHQIDMANHTQTLDRIYTIKQRPHSTIQVNNSGKALRAPAFNVALSASLRNSIENHTNLGD